MVNRDKKKYLYKTSINKEKVKDTSAKIDSGSISIKKAAKSKDSQMNDKR